MRRVPVLAQSQDYSSSDANYHIWTATSVAGVDMSPAQQAALFSTWRNSEWVAPGAPANAPDGEEIDLPVSLHDGPDPIIIQTNSAQLAWTNYTLPGHDFDPGQVVNSVVTINTSGVSVTYLSSVGTGIGPLGTVNGVIGPAFFGASQQAAIIQYYTGVAIPDPFTPHH
jgi:hypothetical protein